MFVAWSAHQKPSTAAKLPPGSKTLSVVQPLLCISKADSHDKLHILKGPGEKQGMTGLRLHRDHTQVQQVSGSKHLLQLHREVGGSPPFPSPATLGSAWQGSKATGWTLDAIGTRRHIPFSIFPSHCLGSLAFKHCREKSLLARQ